MVIWRWCAYCWAKAPTRRHPTRCVQFSSLISSFRRLAWAIDPLSLHYRLTLQDGWTPLHIAALNGRLEVVRLLLGKGVNKEAVSKVGCAPAFRAEEHAPDLAWPLDLSPLTTLQDGWTPLHFAALSGHLEVIRLLLQKGAKKEAADEVGVGTVGRRQCHQQHSYPFTIPSSLSVYSPLYNHSTLTFLQDGWTPLHISAWKGHLEVVGLLLSKGANKAAADEVRLPHMSGWGRRGGEVSRRLALLHLGLSSPPHTPWSSHLVSMGSGERAKEHWAMLPGIARIGGATVVGERANIEAVNMAGPVLPGLEMAGEQPPKWSSHGSYCSTTRSEWSSGPSESAPVPTSAAHQLHTQQKEGKSKIGVKNIGVKKIGLHEFGGENGRTGIQVLFSTLAA
jgi:uncharacterized protein YerC